ncbi:MAG: putative toxin-antitoxin system toxin component, PIN family [Nanoarchaeota archaeon]|nr:putative toxin-antitoxin system toxin component, PIN family [Nanoarchaeota archaeon]
MNIVLDTNVLISATFWNGAAHELLIHAEKNDYQLFISPFIIEEYQETLNDSELQTKINIKKINNQEAIEQIINMATIILPTTKINLITEDIDDNEILACAIDSKADYLVTRDNHLLKIEKYNQIKIIRPEEILPLIRKMVTKD